MATFTVGGVRSAAALTEENGSAGNDTYYVGIIDPPGALGNGQYLCEDPDTSANGNANWRSVGSTSALNDDWRINAGGGADTVTLIRTDDTVVSIGDCAGTWDAMVYGAGNFFDVAGDDGNDTIFGGPGWTYTDGVAGADTLYQYSGTGQTYGYTGNDVLYGMAGSADQLYGEADSDCLQDSNNSWTTYLCGTTGTDSDQYYHTNIPSGGADCESSTSCCGFC
ncbi:MAG: hypothetical protein IT379_14840 [Deltaproteobacteria bacterium]|nr:hypothetical protein [Deltaproteobacteria bacterium]